MRTITSTRSRAVRTGAALSAATAGLMLLAACGSGGNSAAASGGDASGTTVSVRDSGGMKVLATSTGRTLYSSDQEKGKVLCMSGACTAIWVPLTVANGQAPTGSGGITADLGTIKRQDGTQQVTFDERPLYTFSFDQSAGQTTGNGKTDSFDGTDFTWHAVTPSGMAAPGSGSDSSGGSGYGSSGNSGYGY